MHNSSNKSKGYMPVPSGPNMTGFDMGKTSSLMEMMQTGGQTTAGGAALARALQMQKDQKRLEQAQRAEADRQKRGGLFGSVASFAGGLLGGAIGGPAGAAIGAGLGKGLGERAGAGKARDYDASGTVFSQQSFRDVDEASEDFNEGMLGRSLLAGAQTGLTAGLTPGGGIYGTYNPLRGETSARISGRLAGLFNADAVTPKYMSGLSNIGKAMSGQGIQSFGGEQSLFGFSNPVFDIYTTNPVDVVGMEDGGLIGYQVGGITDEDEESGLGIGAGVGAGTSTPQSSSLENILGFELTPQQEALFQARDTSAITRGAEQLGQGLLGMTGGQGLASAGTGFGAGQSAISQAVEGMQQSYDQGIADEAKAFESQVKGTAAELIGGGAEFKVADSVPKQPPTSPPASSLPNTSWIRQGADGRKYVWTGSEWVTG